VRADGRQRIVAGAPATLTWQGIDSNGEPADPGTVTVGVVRADGTVLIAPLTATTGSGDDPRAVALTAAQTANLDVLTATWTVSGTVVATTQHEIVGGVYMTTAEIRAAEPTLADEARHPTAALIAARDRTERAWEAECGRAFVPRFRVATARRGVLPDFDIRAIRSVSDTDGNTLSYSHTAGSRVLDDLFTSPAVVAYEYGWDAPPGDLLEKFARTVRLALNASSSPIDGRAMSFTSPTGETQRFPTPGLGPWIYGIPDVDQVIMRHRVNVPGFA
jgi:hypothetical protein